MVDRELIRSRVLVCEANLAAANGNHGLSVRIRKEILDWAIASEKHHNLPGFHHRLARAYVRRGELGLADEYCRKALELATQRKAHSILAYSRLSLAEILVLQNKLDQAEEILADYLTQGDALGGLFQAKVLLQYCKLLVVRGRDHEGNEVLEHCLECFLAECDTPRQFWLIDEAIAQVNETGGVHGSNL